MCCRVRSPQGSYFLRRRRETDILKLELTLPRVTGNTLANVITIVGLLLTTDGPL